MALKKINDLTAAISVNSTMQFETDIGGATANKVTALQLDTYFLTGKAGGRTFTGGSAASENLILQSTSNATKGQVQIGAGSVLHSNTTNYETLVLNDNDIPNKKYVDDTVIVENLWDRVGTVLSPHNSGDSIESSAATGTPPFVVSSTTVVPNLNVSFLEGYGQSSFFLLGGRAGGQTAYGGTAASDEAVINSTSNITKGRVVLEGLLSISSTTGLIWNDGGAAINARFEGDKNDYLLFLNGTSDQICMGTNTPDGAYRLTLGGALYDGVSALNFKSTETTLAPLTIASTAVVTNLNAERWNGNLASVSDPSVNQILYYNGTAWVNTSSPTFTALTTATIYGGTTSGANLTLYSTSHSSKGSVRLLDNGDTLILGTPTLNSTPSVRVVYGESGYSSPSAVAAKANGDKLILWNNTGGFKSAIGVDASELWYQATQGSSSTTARHRWYLGVNGSATEALQLYEGSGFIWNETGYSAYDFRCEGDTNANLLFLDASSDQACIGTNTPTTNCILTVNGNLSVLVDIQLTSTGVIDFGAPITEGSWRQMRSGTALSFYRYESGSYVLKYTILA